MASFIIRYEELFFQTMCWTDRNRKGMEMVKVSCSRVGTKNRHNILEHLLNYQLVKMNAMNDERWTHNSDCRYAPIHTEFSLCTPEPICIFIKNVVIAEPMWLFIIMLFVVIVNRSAHKRENCSLIGYISKKKNL